MYAFHHEREGSVMSWKPRKCVIAGLVTTGPGGGFFCNRNDIVPTFHLHVLKGSCHAVAKSIKILGHNRLCPACITLC